MLRKTAESSVNLPAFVADMIQGILILAGCETESPVKSLTVRYYAYSPLISSLCSL